LHQNLNELIQEAMVPLDKDVINLNIINKTIELIEGRETFN
jgi:hypothetical protein